MTSGADTLKAGGHTLGWLPVLWGMPVLCDLPKQAHALWEEGEVPTWLRRGGTERLCGGNAAAAASLARAMMPATTLSESCATTGALRQLDAICCTAAFPALEKQKKKK